MYFYPKNIGLKENHSTQNHTFNKLRLSETLDAFLRYCRLFICYFLRVGGLSSLVQRQNSSDLHWLFFWPIDREFPILFVWGWAILTGSRKRAITVREISPGNENLMFVTPPNAICSSAFSTIVRRNYILCFVLRVIHATNLVKLGQFKYHSSLSEQWRMTFR